MRYRYSAKGIAVVCFWAALLVALVCWVVWALAWRQPWLWLVGLLMWAGLCALLWLRWHHAFVQLTRLEVRVRTGWLYIRTRRLPRTYITGLSIFQLPPQRLARVCCVVVYAAGQTLLLPVLSLDAARALENALMVDE